MGFFFFNIYIVFFHEHHQPSETKTTHVLLGAHVNLLFMTLNVETLTELTFSFLSLQYRGEKEKKKLKVQLNMIYSLLITK